MDPVFAATLRGSLGVLLLAAAWHKLRDRGGFRATLREYRIVPERALGLAAAATIALEAATALALLASAPLVAAPLLAAVAPLPASGPLLAAGLLALYSAAIALNVARGRRDIDCGCLGPALRQPIGPAVLVRNLVLLAAALACLAPVRPRPVGWVDAVTVVGAVATLAALYAATQHLIAAAPGLAELRVERGGPR